MKLLQATFSARGDGLHQSPLHRRALELGVGAPLHATGERISYEGSDYAYQVFARDTLFEDSERPGDAQCLSHLMVAGCQRQVWAWRSSRRAIAPWAPSSDHRISTISSRRPQQLGYPLSGRAGTRQYDFQVFSADVLFDSLPKTVRKHPGDIKRLSIDPRQLRRLSLGRHLPETQPDLRPRLPVPSTGARALDWRAAGKRPDHPA